jgi:hypothetical protein
MFCSHFSSVSFRLLLLLFVSVSSCTTPRFVEIKPEISASRAGIDLTNKDSFIYPGVTVFVKGHYFAEVGDLAAGQTVHLPFEKFVNADGKHFDVATMAPEAIRVRAWIEGKAVSKIFAVK